MTTIDAAILLSTLTLASMAVNAAARWRKRRSLARILKDACRVSYASKTFDDQRLGDVTAEDAFKIGFVVGVGMAMCNARGEAGIRYNTEQAEAEIHAKIMELTGRDCDITLEIRGSHRRSIGR